MSNHAKLCCTTKSHKAYMTDLGLTKGFKIMVYENVSVYLTVTCNQ